MTPDDWKQVRHFGPNEKWGNPAQMALPFVMMLDAFRAFVKVPIVVSSGTQGNHVVNSLHYLGCAADIVFPGLTILNALDLFITASRFGFTELGIYTAWTYAGKPVAGMHVGYLESDEKAPRRLWIGTSAILSDGTPARVAFTLENLRTYGFLAAS